MDVGTAPDILAEICANTRRQVAERKAAMPASWLKKKIAADHDHPRGFGLALKNTVATGRCGLIAEIKKASPSGGLIRADFDPASIARVYQTAGATCLSVLTDRDYFQGDPEHLRLARAACSLPVLRKDFLLDPWQVLESRALGADCILLIMAALTNEQALELEGVARDLGLDVLVEVHTRGELDRALGLQTPLLGVNNRDLKAMRTDLAATEELAPHVPPDRILISESGIRSKDDVHRLSRIGAQCILVGESLLRQADLHAAVHELIGPCAA
jgi:indole-3-glycerol phosphate synthase